MSHKKRLASQQGGQDHLDEKTPNDHCVYTKLAVRTEESNQPRPYDP